MKNVAKLARAFFSTKVFSLLKSLQQLNEPPSDANDIVPSRLARQKRMGLIEVSKIYLTAQTPMSGVCLVSSA